MEEPVSFLGAIEVVDRAGHVHGRVRVESLPFRMGRALDNDLVLDDIYVCPHHAELVQTETGLALVDRDSVNGSFRGHERKRSAQIELTGNVELRLGHTLLRFRSAGESLPATEPDPLASSRLMSVDSARWAFAALALGALLIGLQTVLGSNQKLPTMALAGQILQAVLMLLIWALCWSLVNRVVGHRFHYLGHLAVGALGLVGASVLDTVLSYLGFAFSAQFDLFGTLLGGALLSLVVYGHLRLISRGSGRRLLMPAAVVGLAFLALTNLPDVGDDRFQSEPELATTVKPPFAALRGGRSSETYYSDALSVFDDADADAKDED